MTDLFMTTNNRLRAAVLRKLSRMMPFVVMSVAMSLSSCETPADAVETAKTKIIDHLERQGIYDRNTSMNDLPPNINADNIMGRYDVIGGVYRYIVREDRPERSTLPEVNSGDSISFMFKASIFPNTTSYFSNIPEEIQLLGNNNPESGALRWSTEPLRIKVGGDPGILKAIQITLVGCRAAGEKLVPVENDDEEDEPDDGEEVEYTTEPVASDVVKIYITPNLGYGKKANNVVPGNSTLVWELSDIRIIE